MKRIIVCLLALVMVLALCACGDNSKNDLDEANDTDENDDLADKVDSSDADNLVDKGESAGSHTCADKDNDHKCDTCGETLSYSEGLEFTLEEDGESYSVTGIGTCEDTDVVIPSTYAGLFVTSIGNCAFQCCDSLTSITIPESVTSIGSYAFAECTSLASIKIPNNVTSIEDHAFAWCDKSTSITFDGTKAQWEAIEKGGSWNDDFDGEPLHYTVHCTDGDITK